MPIKPKPINNKKELIETLEMLSKDSSYIFRGQPNKNFPLRPKIFRKHEEEKCRRDFERLTNYEKWQPAEETKKFIDSLPINGCLDALRIKDITIFTMMHNYNLIVYFKECSKNDIGWLDHTRWVKENNELIKCIIDERVSYWTSEKTFQRGFAENIAFATQADDLDTNKVLMPGAIINELTVIDETRPQHYGISTTALDWTYNPY